jgi:streptogramin lyase
MTLTRPVLIAALALACAVAVAPAAGGGSSPKLIRVGGSPLELLSAHGSLWVLTCDRHCSGEGRRSAGRIVRIDPQRGRILASSSIDRPGAIAVAADGVFATDFYRHEIRRLDPATLQETTRLKLVLPPGAASRSSYAAFLPNDVTAGAGAVWVSTEWCMLARVDEQLNQAVAGIRLPCDAYQTMAFGAGALWISESLAGLYRIDSGSNSVTARIQIGPKTARLVVTRLLFGRGRVLALGAWTKGGSLTGSNGLARIDPTRNRVVAVTPLSPGPLLAAFGAGSLWVARVNGSTLERIDPSNGRILGRFHAKVGTALAIAGGHLWTADRNGTLRRLGTA